MEENVDMNPAQLDPTVAFRVKLELQRVAADAVNKANIDSQLRRALLRKRTGQQSILSTGDRCYYWRDGIASGSKLPNRSG